MSICWGQNAYAPIPADLGLRHGLKWRVQLPSGWTNRRSTRTHEETVETILSLHLSDVCDESLRLIGKAGDHWGGADLIGLDKLGRVHLFELKAGSITKAATRQLSYYLLRRVFVDPASFLGSWWERMGDWELQPWRLGLALAGALAGQRTDNIGWKFAYKWGSTNDVAESQWSGLGVDSKYPILLDALLAKAAKHCNDLPTSEEVLDYASLWRERLWPDPKTPQGAFKCRRPVVIWLVGTSFSLKAEEEIRRWRAAGVDARCLQAETRHSIHGNGLILRINREDAPRRAKLFKRLEKWRSNQTELIAKPELELEIYAQAQPSSSRTVKEKAGQLQDRMVARVKLPTGEIEEIVEPEY